MEPQDVMRIILVWAPGEDCQTRVEDDKHEQEARQSGTATLVVRMP